MGKHLDDPLFNILGCCSDKGKYLSGEDHPQRHQGQHIQLDSDAPQGSTRVNQDSFRCERMLATVSASIAFDCGVDETMLKHIDLPVRNAEIEWISTNGPNRLCTNNGYLCTSSTHFSRVGRSYGRCLGRYRNLKTQERES
jgi:hypothetical protein